MTLRELKDLIGAYNRQNGTIYTLVHGIGRPVGTKTIKSKLDEHSILIREMIRDGNSKRSICNAVGCHHKTLDNFIKNNLN